MIHFGLKLRDSKYGHKLEKENYAIINNKNSFYPKMDNSLQAHKLYEDMRRPYQRGIEPWTDETRTKYTDEWCQWHYNNCLENFDLNMAYFSGLDRGKFCNALDVFLFKNKQFIPVSDLQSYQDVPGYYLMILDEYCQVYIGTTQNIAKRIRTHWTAKKPFDRVLLPIGNVKGSVMSIDSFRALDTTRIFAHRVRNVSELYQYEEEYIRQIPNEFLTNRITGGMLLAPLPSNIKTRNLT